MKHTKLLDWKKNYHRFGVSHHYVGKDLRNDKDFKSYLYPGKEEKRLKALRRIGHPKNRLNYFPIQLKVYSQVMRDAVK